MATRIPPEATIAFGPRWGPKTSANQPATGVSQVSSAMKMAKAHWIAARDQSGCAALIGFTNSVQPYCRLAIEIMQMMTDTSCVHRVADDAFAPTPTVLATVIFPPPIVFARGFRVRAGYADLTENKPALVRASIRRNPILRSHADHKQPWLFAALDP